MASSRCLLLHPRALFKTRHSAIAVPAASGPSCLRPRTVAGASHVPRPINPVTHSPTSPLSAQSRPLPSALPYRILRRLYVRLHFPAHKYLSDPGPRAMRISPARNPVWTFPGDPISHDGCQTVLLYQPPFPGSASVRCVHYLVTYSKV